MARSLSIHKDGALTRSKELALSRAKAKLDRRSILKRGGRNLCTGVYCVQAAARGRLESRSLPSAGCLPYGD